VTPKERETIRNKVQALSLKTTSNGATAAEEAAAKQKLSELLLKLNKPSQPIRQTPSRFPEKSKSAEIEKFKQYEKEGTLSEHVLDVDWDTIAGAIFSSEEFMSYVKITETAWELRNITANGLNKRADPSYLTADMYRRRCYEAFITIHRGKLK
jgi:hypothetical protein